MAQPLYILAAAPSNETKIRGIFESKQGSIAELLRDPGSLRYGGWDLQTLDTPKIVKGEYLEVTNSDRKILRLYEDGTFIFQCLANDEFLGWPRKREGFFEHPRLNPMAIIEVTYCFVDFYKKLIAHFFDKPTSISFRSELRNTILENKKKIYMIPFGVGTYGWLFDDERYPAPQENMKKDVNVSVDDVLELHSHVAYLLIEALYLWFGIPDDSIPYITKDTKGHKIVDTEKIIHSK